MATLARNTGMVGLLALGATGLGWLGWRHRHNLQFYWKLWHAQRVAAAFYGSCATVTKDIAYMGEAGPRLDVYRPEGADGCPVFVYVYGGSWHSGHKKLYSPVAQRLLPDGLVVVVPDYTLYPGAGYPRQSEQIAAALAWTLDNIARFGGDPRRVVVGAQSAGAQIAGLALLDPRFLAAHGRQAGDMRGFIGVSGVYDVPAEVAYVSRRWTYSQFLTNVMGGPQNLTAASPITHVRADAPPMLLIHGDADTTVPLDISRAFHERLRSVGARSELVIYEGGGHSGLLFDALVQNPPRLINDMLRFVRQHAGPLHA